MQKHMQKHAKQASLKSWVPSLCEPRLLRDALLEMLQHSSKPCCSKARQEACLQTSLVLEGWEVVRLESISVVRTRNPSLWTHLKKHWQYISCHISGLGPLLDLRCLFPSKHWMSPTNGLLISTVLTGRREGMGGHQTVFRDRTLKITNLDSKILPKCR